MFAQVALIIIVPEPQLMMPRVLRCDLEGVHQLLLQLESDTTSKHTQKINQKINTYFIHTLFLNH